VPTLRNCTFLSCPGRSAARSGALPSRGRNERRCLVRSRCYEAALRAASRPGHRSHRAFDPRDLDVVAEPADAQNLLSLADG
jgi:hypothetical protein